MSGELLKDARANPNGGIGAKAGAASDKQVAAVQSTTNAGELGRASSQLLQPPEVSNAYQLTDIKRRRLKVIDTKLKDAIVSPVGLLALHVKRLHIYDLDLYDFVQRYDVSVYLRILVANQIKYTVMYTRVKVPATLILDELIHFRIETSQMRSDVSNQVHIEVIFCDPTNQELHKIVANKDMHLYDIINRLCDIRSEELRDVEKERPAAKVEIEACFAYGEFGFGFSNQFQCYSAPNNTMLHSVFYRPPPIEDRLNIKNDVTRCDHIGHPKFIFFSSEALFSGFYGSEHGDSENEEDQHLFIFNERIKERVRKVKVKYDAFKTRKERLEYLVNYVNNSNAHQQVHHHCYRLKPNFILRQRRLKTKGSSLFGSPQVETHKMDVELSEIKQSQEPLPDTRQLEEVVSHEIAAVSTNVALTNHGRIKIHSSYHPEEYRPPTPPLRSFFRRILRRFTSPFERCTNFFSSNLKEFFGRLNSMRKIFVEQDPPTSRPLPQIEVAEERNAQTVDARTAREEIVRRKATWTRMDVRRKSMHY